MEHTTSGPLTTETAPPERRWFFRVLTGAAGAIATAAVGLPLVGYFLGQRKRNVAWVALGSVAEFPLNETRMVLFDNPLRQPC